MFRAFFFRRPVTFKSAETCSLPCGEGWGEGILQIAATFPNTLTLTVPIQALRLVALSLALSHGREDGVAVGIKGSARKTGCAGCFLFFRRPASTAVNPSCFSNRLQRLNLLQPAPSPVGEGWGEGIPRIAAIFPNTLTTLIQALRLVALSLALSHGREDGVAVGIKRSARKQVVQAAFCFSDDLYKRSIQAALYYYFQ